jgi:hypothetical protein
MKLEVRPWSEGAYTLVIVNSRSVVVEVKTVVRLKVFGQAEDRDRERSSQAVVIPSRLPLASTEQKAKSGEGRKERAL